MDIKSKKTNGLLKEGDLTVDQGCVVGRTKSSLLNSGRLFDRKTILIRRVKDLFIISRASTHSPSPLVPDLKKLACLIYPAKRVQVFDLLSHDPLVPS